MSEALDLQLIEDIQTAGLADHGFGEGKIGGYRMQQHPGEFAALVQALQGRPIHRYLQVGSAAGGSERFLCERLGVRDLTIIDMGDHEQFPIWQNQNKPALLAQGIRVTEHIGDSHDQEAEIFLLQNGYFDLIGIDGDHTPAGVRLDWELIAGSLRPGVLVWMHDINNDYMRTRDNGPWEVWQVIKTRHKVLLETMQKFGIGLVEIV